MVEMRGAMRLADKAYRPIITRVQATLSYRHGSSVAPVSNSSKK